MKKKIILILMLALCLALLTGCGDGNKLDLESCIVADVRGTNGNGVLTLRVDDYKLERDMAQAMGESKYFSKLDSATGFEMSIEPMPRTTRPCPTATKSPSRSNTARSSQGSWGSRSAGPNSP